MNLLYAERAIIDGCQNHTTTGSTKVDGNKIVFSHYFQVVFS